MLAVNPPAALSSKLVNGATGCLSAAPVGLRLLRVSGLAAHATLVNALATADHTAAAKVEARANLATTLARINGQLDAFAKPLPRPVKTVEQALSWAASVPTVTRSCMRSPQEAARDEDCRKVIELRKELAAARDYERLMQEAGTLRDKLAGLNIGAAHDPMPQAFEATLGRVIQLDGRSGIALMATLMLGLVSALGPFGLDTLRGRLLPPALPQPARGADPSLESAQGKSAQGAQVIQFRSAQADMGVCPPSPATRRAPRPTRAPAPARSGQTSKPAQDTSHDAAPRAGTRPAQGRVNHSAAAAAVNALVGMLPKGKHARATGSELANAYAAHRGQYGWPPLPANVIGMHLKTAVEALGGRKLKSGVQVYEGVCLPAGWREIPARSA
jgi:hypothetical protein